MEFEKPKQTPKISSDNENSKQERKLTPEEKEIVKSLEGFPFLLKKDKVFFVLVWRGLKTASSVSIVPDAPESAINDLKKITEKAGLFFNFGHETTEDSRGLTKGKVCFVANNQKDLDLMSELWFSDHDNDEKVYREIGRMSGFPQTAIDTYDAISKAGILPLSGEEKERVLENYIFSSSKKRKFLLESGNSEDIGVIPFSQLFYMSKEYYKDEMETPRRWAKELELVSFSLYREFTAPFYRSADLREEEERKWE